MAVAGSFGAAPCGAAVGSHLAFAAFGARTRPGFGTKNGAVLALQFLPLPWALVGGVAMEAALRFAWRRLPDDRAPADRLRRQAGASPAAWRSGSSPGSWPESADRGRVGFRSSLNGGEVWFYATVLHWFWAWFGLRRQG